MGQYLSELRDLRARRVLVEYESSARAALYMQNLPRVLRDLVERIEKSLGNDMKGTYIVRWMRSSLSHKQTRIDFANGRDIHLFISFRPERASRNIPQSPWQFATEFALHRKFLSSPECRCCETAYRS